MATKKSGAQRRKESKAVLVVAEARANAVARDWLNQGGYQQSIDPNGPPIQLPIYGQPPPSFIPAVEAAINQLEIGNFYLPAILWDGMLRDDRVSSSLVTRISGLLGQELVLDPPDKSTMALKVRDEIAKLERMMLPPPQLAQLLRTGIGLSVGIAQVLTTKTLKSHTPTIQVWNNRFLWWDWLIRRYRMTTENQGTIVIDPEDPEWLIWEPYGPLGWLSGAKLRSLAAPWSIRYWVRKWWARYQEVHGQPVRLGIIPPERTPRDERTFLAQIGNFAHEAVVRLPQGTEGNRFDLKLLEATSNNWQGFMKLIEHCDKSIEIDLLGQTMSTEGQGGLGSQERGGEATLVRILKGDALVGDALRQRVLMPYCQDNYGNAELAPFMDWQVEPPQDLEKKGRAFLSMSKALSGLDPNARALVDEEQLLNDFQIPIKPEEEREPPEDLPAPPPTGGSEEDDELDE